MPPRIVTQEEFEALQAKHPEKLVRKPGRSLPLGKAWIGHCGPRAQRRYLKQRWARIEKLKDAASRMAREQLLDAVCDDPDPEFAALHLGHVALAMAEEIGRPWAECVASILIRLDAEREKRPVLNAQGVPVGVEVPAP